MTTKNNPINQVGGIEKARGIVNGAPDGATTVRISLCGKQFLYGRCENSVSGNLILLNDLRTAIAEHDEQIKCWSCNKYMTKSQHSANDGFCIHCSNEVDL